MSNYIGSKRGNPQVCLTRSLFTPFSLKVAWSGKSLIKPTDFLGERVLGEVSSDQPTVQGPVDSVVVVVAGAVGVGEDGEG